MLRSMLFLLTAVAGAASAFQAAANAALADRAGLGAALVVNSSIVFAATWVLALATGGLATLPAVLGAPPQNYIGGFCGFLIIACLAFAFPRIGGALAMALLVLGQGTAALAIDHFGLWGARVTPLSPARLAGAALVAVGVLLMRR